MMWKKNERKKAKEKVGKNIFWIWAKTKFEQRKQLAHNDDALNARNVKHTKW